MNVADECFQSLQYFRIIESFIFPFIIQNSSMNYNQMNRNSLINCIYSDRPAYPYNQPTDSWKNTPNQQHLNPSKSKVNVRQSLNKTTENYTSTNPTITNIRNSCLLNNSVSTHNPPKDVFQEDKYFKAAKENQEPFFAPLPKDNYTRYSQINQSPATFEERRKSESAHLRSCSNNDFLFKLDNQLRTFDIDKSEKAQKVQKTQSGDQLKELIVALTKRVASNQEDIAKLKDKSDKEKRVQTIETQLSQYKNKLFELAKFNSKNFIDFDTKLQQHQLNLTEVRQKLFTFNSGEDASKKVNLLQAKLSQLYEGFKTREESIDKHFNAQFMALDSSFKKFMNEDLPQIKNGLQSSKKQTSQLANRLKKLEVDLGEDFKKSNKKCLNSLTLQSKQVLIIRQNQLIKDRTKQYINYPPSSRKEFMDQIPKRDYDSSRKELQIEQPKRELIIKQKLYYIDTSGFLLDENKFYLLNNKNQQILLPDHLINCLRENNLLSGVTLRR